MESYIAYWKEILRRGDTNVLRGEFPILVEQVGIARLFRLAINDYEGSQEMVKLIHKTIEDQQKTKEPSDVG